MTKRSAEQKVIRAAASFSKIAGKVEVQSLVNGSLIVIPAYPGFKKWNEEDGGGPGLFSRLSTAKKLETLLNQAALLRQRGRIILRKRPKARRTRRRSV